MPTQAWDMAPGVGPGTRRRSRRASTPVSIGETGRAEARGSSLGGDALIQRQYTSCARGR